ncbi:hypothetical protein C5167_011476 [Papaver somniferum]|uniref:S-adenosyl-L-homocysteine hydrolase NAD binding domain-containing protein n=1 Tax=Papaver somniferum TaxID=3469 RepID=A0A4Y7K777_PAPSO|nr:hypothetical protein C5167_011476 [Papaver somniferum]
MGWTAPISKGIHALRAQLEAAKYDVIKYCTGTLYTRLCLYGRLSTDVMIVGKIPVVAGYGDVGKGCGSAVLLSSWCPGDDH